MNSNYNTCSLPVIFQDEIDVEDEPIEDSVDTIFNDSSINADLQEHTLNTQNDEPIEDSVDTIFNDSSINSDLQEHTLNTENVVWVSICIRIQYRVSTQI